MCRGPLLRGDAQTHLRGGCPLGPGAASLAPSPRVLGRGPTPSPAVLIAPDNSGPGLRPTAAGCRPRPLVVRGSGQWAGPPPPPPPGRDPRPLNPAKSGPPEGRIFPDFWGLRCNVQGGWGGSAHWPDPTAQSASIAAPRRRSPAAVATRPQAPRRRRPRGASDLATPDTLAPTHRDAPRRPRGASDSASQGSGPSAPHLARQNLPPPEGSLRFDRSARRGPPVRASRPLGRDGSFASASLPGA